MSPFILLVPFGKEFAMSDDGVVGIFVPKLCNSEEDKNCVIGLCRAPTRNRRDEGIVSEINLYKVLKALDP